MHRRAVGRPHQAAIQHAAIRSPRPPSRAPRASAPALRRSRRSPRGIPRAANTRPFRRYSARYRRRTPACNRTPPRTGRTVVPSPIAKTLTSRPSSRSSSRCRCRRRGCRLPYHSASTASALAASSHTTTPLPAAKPSAFTTHAAAPASSARSRARERMHDTRSRRRDAVALHESLGEDFAGFQPPARLRPGPNTVIPASRNLSRHARPRSPFPGPTRPNRCPLRARALGDRFTFGRRATFQFSPRGAVPALPGAGEDRVHEGDCAKPPRQRVFARAVAHDQNLHSALIPTPRSRAAST